MFKYSGMISAFDEMEALRVDGAEWLDLIGELEIHLGSSSHLKQILEISSKFKAVSQDWESYCEETVSQSNKFKSRAIKQARKRDTASQKNQYLNSKDKEIQSQALEWAKLLQELSSLWGDNIKHIEDTVQGHRSRSQSRSSNYISKIEKDLIGIPSLDLRKINPDESELISNRSPFTNRSRDVSGRPSRRAMPPLPRSNTSEDSFEWKKDSRTDIRKALNVLHKARLLSPSNQQLLVKLAEAVKNSSASFEGLLQNLKRTSPKQMFNFTGKDLQKTIVTSEREKMSEMGLDELLDCSSVDCSIEQPPQMVMSGSQMTGKHKNSDYHATGSTKGTHHWRSQHALVSSSTSYRLQA